MENFKILNYLFYFFECEKEIKKFEIDKFVHIYT